MKRILCLIVLLGLLLASGAAMADDTVPCFWQLEAVETASGASDRYGPAAAASDIAPLSGLDAAAMTQAVRGVRTLSLDVTRASNGARAHADYTLSGVPALVPGCAYARLTLTAATDCQAQSFYLYTTLSAGGSHALRVRGNGAWVHRVFFPRKAVPGTERRIRLVSREMHDLARTEVTYVYRAHAGVMVIAPDGDVVLYDLDGNEIGRVAQTVEDILPVYAQDLPGQADSATLFAAERQEDGSLIVTFDPDSGLTEEELIRLLRAATASGQAADASAGATAVSPLRADGSSATL